MSPTGLVPLRIGTDVGLLGLTAADIRTLHDDFLHEQYMIVLKDTQVYTGVIFVPKYLIWPDRFCLCNSCMYSSSTKHEQKICYEAYCIVISFGNSSLEPAAVRTTATPAQLNC